MAQTIGHEDALLESWLAVVRYTSWLASYQLSVILLISCKQVNILILPCFHILILAYWKLQTNMKLNSNLFTQIILKWYIYWAFLISLIAGCTKKMLYLTSIQVVTKLLPLFEKRNEKMSHVVHNWQLNMVLSHLYMHTCPQLGD
jgi:hypothetical protein